MVQKFANFLFQVQNSKKNRQIEGKTSRVSRISHDESFLKLFQAVGALRILAGKLANFWSILTGLSSKFAKKFVKLEGEHQIVNIGQRGS